MGSRRPLCQGPHNAPCQSPDCQMSSRILTSAKATHSHPRRPGITDLGPKRESTHQNNPGSSRLNQHCLILARLPFHGSRMFAFSSDNRGTAATTDKGVMIWDVQDVALDQATASLTPTIESGSVRVRLAQRGVRRSGGIAAESQLESGKKVEANEIVKLIFDPPITGLPSTYRPAGPLP